MMYDYKLNLVIRTPRACPWEQSADDDKNDIRNYLEKNGTLLLVLDRIGTIYDLKGQNVMFSVPLNTNTRDINPDNGRNLIFFQDGHLRYEWEKTGGILL